MAIHIHLFDCNCIFCGSDFPLDFFQSRNEDGPNTQSATIPQQEDSDPLDDYPDPDEDEENEEESDDENDGDHESEEEIGDPKPNKPNEKKKIFGFLVGKHEVCVL